MLFKILHGDASRISTDITPFHEGYCYVTHDGYMYVDMNVGTVDEPDNQRIKLNAGNSELLTGYTFDQIIEAAKATASAQDVVVLAESQAYTDAALDGYARIGAESDDDRELTIYGVREFATRAAETVVGDANDSENDNTVYGAKNFAVNYVDSQLDTYILNIDYDTLLAFDTSEIVIGATSTTSVLGQAILGQLVLA